MFLIISQNSQEKTCARISFLIKLQALVCTFIKIESLAQVFSYEFRETFKNTVFYRTLPVAASARQKLVKFSEIFWSEIFSDVFRTLSSIYDEAFGQNSQRLKVVKYFLKRFHHRCLTASKYAFNHCDNVTISRKFRKPISCYQHF